MSRLAVNIANYELNQRHNINVGFLVKLLKLRPPQLKPRSHLVPGTVEVTAGQNVQLLWEHTDFDFTVE